MSLLQLPTLNTISAVSPSSVVNIVASTPFIVLHTIDIDETDLAVLKSYGKVVNYDIAVEGSLPLTSLVCDYLCLNLRVKADRNYYDSQDTSQCKVVCYISLLEKFDSLIQDLGCHNVITSFPDKTHFKADFDKLLLANATDSPSKCLSVLNFAANFFASLRRKDLVS